MKPSLRLIIAAFGAMSALLGCQAASAVTLSPQDCHAYPFAKVAHPTHRDKMQELRLYEKAGYNPGKQDPEYPDSVEDANQALHTAYQQECAPQ